MRECYAVQVQAGARTLRELRLAHNRIGPTGANCLSNALCCTPTLVVLDLNGNSFLSGFATVDLLNQFPQFSLLCTDDHIAQHLNFVQIPFHVVRDSKITLSSDWSRQPLLQWLKMRLAHSSLVSLGLELLLSTFKAPVRDQDKTDLIPDQDKTDLIPCLLAILNAHNDSPDIKATVLKCLQRVIHDEETTFRGYEREPSTRCGVWNFCVLLSLSCFLLLRQISFPRFPAHAHSPKCGACRGFCGQVPYLATLCDQLKVFAAVSTTDGNMFIAVLDCLERIVRSMRCIMFVQCILSTFYLEFFFT